MGGEIEEVKSKTDIVALVSEYVPLTKSGKNYKGLCPFHNEKTPSFMVSPELQIFKCFGCGKGGDVFSFIKEIEGLEFRETLELLAKRAGVKLSRRKFTQTPEDAKLKKIIEINELSSNFYNYILKNHKVGERALDYLRKRGISNDAIDVFKLGYSPNTWDSVLNFLTKRKYDVVDIAASGLIVPRENAGGFYDRFRGRLIVPLRNQRGEVVSFSGRSLGKEDPKYINGPETLSYKKDRYLYNLDLARREMKKEKQAILVEGYFDVISPYMAGFKNIVASSGTSLTVGQLSLIKNYAREVMIFYDTDLAGIEATKRALNLISSVGLDVKVGILPEGIKDPDEAVRKGKKIFVQSLKDASSIYDFYFKYALKENDPTEPLGKKRISDFLLPLIASINHDIERALYIKKLADLIGVSDEIIKQALSRCASGRNAVESGGLGPVSPKLTSEEYIMSLVLKSPIDLAQKTLYKLSTNDFTNDLCGSVFSRLKEYLLDKERFLVKNFYNKLSDEERNLAERLYLMEMEILDRGDEDILDKEIKKVFDIIKKETLKRRLKDLSLKIKEAEESDNASDLKSYQSEFSSLSKKLK